MNNYLDTKWNLLKNRVVTHSHEIIKIPNVLKKINKMITHDQSNNRKMLKTNTDMK